MIQHLTHLVTEEHSLKSYKLSFAKVFTYFIIQFYLVVEYENFIQSLGGFLFSFSINRFKAKLRLNSVNLRLGLGRLCEGRHLHGCHGENETRSNLNVGNIFESVVKS